MIIESDIPNTSKIPLLIHKLVQFPRLRDYKKLMKKAKLQADILSKELKKDIKMIGPINSAGGSYLILPKATINIWKGSEDMKAYESLCLGPEEGRISSLQKQDILILNTPDSLYFLPFQDGGLFVRIVSLSGDEKLLEKFMKEIPEDDWQFIGEMKIPHNELWAFDCGIPGKDAENDSLHIHLKPGKYAVSSRTYQPNKKMEVLLTKIKGISFLKESQKNIKNLNKEKQNVLSPATLRYIKIFSRTTLGEGGENVTIKEDKEITKFFIKDITYATFHIEGNEIIVTFRKPKYLTDLHFYKELKKKSNEVWLEWRTPVSRDPRPWLEANIGSVVGKMMHEIYKNI